MEREGWYFCNNSVIQTVTEDWREKAEDNVAIINKIFKDENVDVVVNADQSFVRLFMEEDYVAAQKGTQRIGGKARFVFVFNDF